MPPGCRAVRPTGSGSGTAAGRWPRGVRRPPPLRPGPSPWCVRPSTSSSPAQSRNQLRSSGAGASPGLPFQSLPAVSAFSEALSVCSATVWTISSSETPSPAGWVPVGSLIADSSLWRAVCRTWSLRPSPIPRNGKPARSGVEGPQLEPDPLAPVVVLGAPAVGDRLYQAESLAARTILRELLYDRAHRGAVDDGDPQPVLGRRHLQGQGGLPLRMVDDVGHQLGDQERHVVAVVPGVPAAEQLQHQMTGDRDAGRDRREVDAGGTGAHAPGPFVARREVALHADVAGLSRR